MLSNCPYTVEKNKNTDIIYNSKDFQKENPTIATCGRHCILRALTLLKDEQSLTNYIKMMNELDKVKYHDYP